MSVNVYTGIYGVVPVTKKYKKMLALVEACKEAEIPFPKEVISYFHLEDAEYYEFEPSKDGIEIDLEEVKGAVHGEGDPEYDGGAYYDIDLSKLPENIGKIRIKVWMS